MNGFAQIVPFPAADGFEADTAGRGYVPTSAGTFPLRRARYFSGTGAPSLCAEEQHALTNLVEEVDPDTKHKLIVQNLRMVVNIARHYTNRGLELVDLIRAGNQGLIHAMEKFEPAGGFCFSTFVTWCVSQQIELAIMNRHLDPDSSRLTNEHLDLFDDATLICPRNLPESASASSRESA